MNFDLVDYLYSQILNMKVILILFLFFIAGSAEAQLENKSSLSISTIMEGEGFIGNLPHSISWTPNNKIIYQRDKDNDRIDEYFYSKHSLEEFIELRPVELNDFPLNGYEISENGANLYFTNGPSLFRQKSDSDKPELIYYDLDGFQSIQLVNDSSRIYFFSAGDLFLYDLKNVQVRQITNFINTSEKESKKLSEEEDYLKNQQLELFEIVQSRSKRKAENKNRDELRDQTQPLPIHTGGKYLHNVQISPNEKYVTYILSDYPKNKHTQVEDHVTESGWTESVSARSKIGRKDATHELYIYDLNNRTTLSVVSSDSDLGGMYSRPNYLKDYEGDNYKAEDNVPKNIIFHGPYFSKDGKAIIEIKSYDNKDRWIVLLNLVDGSVKKIDHQHDEAWIGGPGISSWKGVAGNIGWLKDNKTVFFQSEETGYSHLYLYDTEKNKKKQLTEGKFEIHSAKLSLDGNKFYVSANKNHAGNRAFYHLDIKSKKWTSILTEDGNYEVTVSPDEKYLACRYSYKNKPWEIYITENKEANTPTQVTHSLNPVFKDYSWRAPEVIRFKAEDGANVPARVYKPTAENNNHAAVIFVHGAGYLQNAHNWWSGYYREYMFHNLLVDNGYTVLDIDYRASKGYGRDWRTGIYRYMGGKDLSDQVDGRKYLIEQCGVDSNRVGMYGGSYGGFISIMAMLTTDKFPCAAAIRSVTDWAHYNHEYTSNILNTPVLDSIAYRRSSPIYLADNLQGKLLMLHGMVDDNVQYQDVVRLSQRFIELGKENWDLVGYPVEPHGFKEATSWTDEYKRIFKLFQENLR